MDIEWISDVKKSFGGWDKEDGTWALTPILRTCFFQHFVPVPLFHGLLCWEKKINRLLFSESHGMNCGDVKWFSVHHVQMSAVRQQCSSHCCGVLCLEWETVELFRSLGSFLGWNIHWFQPLSCEKFPCFLVRLLVWLNNQVEIFQLLRNWQAFYRPK